MQTWREITSCSLGVKNKAKDVCVVYFIPGQDKHLKGSQDNGECVRNNSQEAAGVSRSTFVTVNNWNIFKYRFPKTPANCPSHLLPQYPSRLFPLM